MLIIRRLSFLFLFLSFTVAGFCQNAPQIAPVPSDSLELVTGATQVPGTPQERASVLELLERARQNGDLHAPGSAAFTLKVNFSGSGNVHYTGSGEMEETWLSPFNFRWSARLGNFELTRISSGRQIFDDKPVDFIPIRVHMLRDAIFWPINFNQAHALIRTATAQWKGSEVTCILTSGGMSDPTPTPGRRWVEREYCIDTKTGLLQILSDAPGIYVLFDYRNSLQFHGRTLASKISIVEGGKTVLEAHLGSIADADQNNTNLLTPTPEMRGNAGPILSGTMRFPQNISVSSGASVIQPVIIHAILDKNGRVLDAELVESSDEAFSQTALALVKQSSYGQGQDARLQREAFINVKFFSQ
ncbi:MAG TPA: hypothetical protein VGN44_21230 [Candidatus Angelobacter sp.]